MSRYDPSAPRAIFGLLAVAMAATTMAVFVVLPAQVEAVAGQPYAAMASDPTPQPNLRVASNAAHDATRCSRPALEARRLRDNSERPTRIAGAVR